ncbi:MAG: WG repeat-containing protein [Flavobacteriales bacterium]|nr:WG repeat-containing protein [Flavobacteriales bacterium]
MIRRNLKYYILGLSFFLSFGAQAENTSGSIPVSAGSFVRVVKGPKAKFYAGEVVKINYSGSLNINPEVRRTRECWTFLSLVCETVHTKIDHWKDPNQYPAAFRLVNGSGQQVAWIPNNGKQSSGGSYSITIPATNLVNFNETLFLEAYVPGSINRQKSRGVYNLSVHVEADNRLERYEAYLKSLPFPSLTDVELSLDRHLLKQYGPEVAELIVNRVREVSAGPMDQAGKEQMKQILKFVEENVAAGNPKVALVLGDFYLQDLQFNAAIPKLKQAVSTILSSGSAPDEDQHFLLGEAYSSLGLLYSEKSFGSISRDLTQASVYFQNSLNHFIKAYSYQEAMKSATAYAKVLRRINTLPALKKANNVLSVMANFYEEYIMIIENGKFGFIDLQGNVKIAPKYDLALGFVPGYELAPVQKNGKWGMINKLGDLAVDYKFDAPPINNMGNFTKYAKLKSGNLYGVYDRSGKIVVPPMFSEIGQIDGEVMYDVVKDGKRGVYLIKRGKFLVSDFMNPSENEYSYYQQGFLIYRNGNSWGVINSKTGKDHLAPNYQFLGPHLSYGDSSSLMMYGSNGKYGIINHSGRVVIPNRYVKTEDVQCYSFLQDLRIFIVREGEKWGVRNLQDKVIVPVQYDQIVVDPLSQKLLLRKAKSWSTCNIYGKDHSAPIQCDQLSVSPDGAMLYVRKNGKYALVTTSGQTITPFEYDQAKSAYQFTGQFSFGQSISVNTNAVPLHVLKRNGKFGAMGNTGIVKIPFDYDILTVFNQAGYALFRNGEVFGVIDKNGVEIYQEKNSSVNIGFVVINSSSHLNKHILTFTLLNELIVINANTGKKLDITASYAYAAKSSNGKWGIINKNGEYTVSPQYDAVQTITPDRFVVYKDYKCGMINTKGDLLIPINYTSIDRYSHLRTIDNSYKVLPSWITNYNTKPEKRGSDSRLVVKKGTEYGYFDLEGNQIWKPTK